VRKSKPQRSGRTFICRKTSLVQIAAEPFGLFANKSGAMPGFIAVTIMNSRKKKMMPPTQYAFANLGAYEARTGIR
jgi:hypothetical protein